MRWPAADGWLAFDPEEIPVRAVEDERVEERER